MIACEETSFPRHGEVSALIKIFSLRNLFPEESEKAFQISTQTKQDRKIEYTHIFLWIKF